MILGFCFIIIKKKFFLVYELTNQINKQIKNKQKNTTDNIICHKNVVIFINDCIRQMNVQNIELNKFM